VSIRTIRSERRDGTRPIVRPTQPEILWQQEYIPDQFERRCIIRLRSGLVVAQSNLGRVRPGSRQPHLADRYPVDPNDAFVQEGLPTAPRTYWLVAEVEAFNGQFGWCTRQWPEHFAADAVSGAGTTLPLAGANPSTRTGTLLRRGTQFGGPRLLPAVRRTGLGESHLRTDDAHALSDDRRPRAGDSDAVSTCETECPSGEVTCPHIPTQFPVVETSCPAVQTECPPIQTVCR